MVPPAGSESGGLATKIPVPFVLFSYSSFPADQSIALRTSL
jgi:hypothetical protein